MSVTKTADGKGRVTLGAKFANKHLIIEEVSDTEVRIQTAVVVPEREAWLMSNSKARNMVIKGVEQAKNGQLVDGPDLDAAIDMCEELEDDEG